MSFVNPEFVERYQLLYQKDPNSKVFASLGEAYRRMGLLDAALEVCRRGVKLHPHFPSGRVALAKVLIDLDQIEEAIEQLESAAELSPENLLAHALLGESHLKLRRPKEALKAFKMVLFLNPQDIKAQEAVRKLESLTADEYDDELFHGTRITHLVSTDRPPQSLKPSSPPQRSDHLHSLERYLSLADAFIVRNDFDKALETLNKAIAELGSHPEIHSRLDLLLQREQDEMLEPLSPIRESQEARSATASASSEAPLKNPVHRKRQRLELLLHRINSRRFDS